MGSDPLTKGERTRNDILQAAHRLFVDQGYHGTSMRQIAQKADIALGGIYNHFESKEAIFVAVLEASHPIRQLIPTLEQIEDQSIEGYVQNAASNMMENLKGRPDILNLIFIENVEFNRSHLPELFDLIFPRVMGLVSLFAERQDKLRPIPLPVLIRAYVGIFLSYYLTEILFREYFPSEFQHGTLEDFIEVYLHGILLEG